MARTPHPIDPSEYRSWLLELERDWEAGLIADPQGVAVIVSNPRGQVLLQLRDDDPDVVFADAWSLPGGDVEDGETPIQAARRELAEETGLDIPLTEWKVYRKKADGYRFIIEQFIYEGRTNLEAEDMALGEGQALRFHDRSEIASLSIAFGFGVILDEYFGSMP